MAEVESLEVVWIPLADGRRLAARPWLPAGARDRLPAQDRYNESLHSTERGTVEAPNLTAIEMRHVFDNGTHSVRDGALTGERADDVLHGCRGRRT